MDQELTFVRRELATNTFWLRSYGTIRKSFTSCQTSCLSRQSMQGKWQITRPIRLRGASCWDVQSHRVNTMQQQSNTLQEAFCFSASFQRTQPMYMHAACKDTRESAACLCSSWLADAGFERFTELGGSNGQVPAAAECCRDLPQSSLSSSLSAASLR